MKKNNKKNNRLNFYNFLQKKTIRLLLKLRYLLLAFRKPVKIGFLRLYNEENTIIPCLMSVIDMTDIIVLIYSDIEDSSLELVRRYIKDNRLEKRFIIRRYPHKVFTQHAPEYRSGKVKPENTLAAYYEFGYKICRRLARFRNGFIFKIDADQIYMNNCFTRRRRNDEKEKIHRHHQFFRRIQRLRHERQILFPVPSSKTRMPERRVRGSPHDLERFCRIRPFFHVGDRRSRLGSSFPAQSMLPFRQTVLRNHVVSFQSQTVKRRQALSFYPGPIRRI